MASRALHLPILPSSHRHRIHHRSRSSDLLHHLRLAPLVSPIFTMLPATQTLAIQTLRVTAWIAHSDSLIAAEGPSEPRSLTTAAEFGQIIVRAATYTAMRASHEASGAPEPQHGHMPTPAPKATAEPPKHKRVVLVLLVSIYVCPGAAVASFPSWSLQVQPEAATPGRSRTRKRRYRAGGTSAARRHCRPAYRHPRQTPRHRSLHHDQ